MGSRILFHMLLSLLPWKILLYDAHLTDEETEAEWDEAIPLPPLPQNE